MAMTSRARRAFTLIELLVVLAIIAMIMALAVPAVSEMLNVTRITAATDILRASVSKSRSVAISTRRSCTLDMAYTEDMGVTKRLTSSVTVVSDDFERYPDGVERLDDLKERWGLQPQPQPLNKLNIWQIVVGQTHELWAGRDNGEVDNAYGWHSETNTPSEAAIDVERTVTARFKMQRINPKQKNGIWGFGVLAHFVRDGRSLMGYRLCVRVQTDTRTGLNKTSEAVLQKLYSPSNPNLENAQDANHLGLKELDLPRVTALLSPGVWYRLKMDIKREDKVVKLAGKVWVDGSPEPEQMTVGPCYDAFGGAALPTGADRSFRQGDALKGGFCGVWVQGAEAAVDDFSVDAREYWLMPEGIHMQAMRPRSGVDMNSGVVNPETDLEAVPAYEPGGFPLSYRPDGTAAAERVVLLRITDVASGSQRFVRIDPNTGRVEVADKL
jgi:prepilin-type N-terminal cleavage/methylation domain-containing protein